MEVTIQLPQGQFISESPEKVTAKIRLYAALGMYQSGELSIGAACELAGVDRYAFLETMKRENIALRTQLPDELADEFARLSNGA